MSSFKSKATMTITMTLHGIASIDHFDLVFIRIKLLNLSIITTTILCFHSFGFLCLLLLLNFVCDWDSNNLRMRALLREGFVFSGRMSRLDRPSRSSWSRGGCEGERENIAERRSRLNLTFVSEGGSDSPRSARFSMTWSPK